MYDDFIELKELIAAELTTDQIMDILGWTTYELVEALSDVIREHEDDFREAI